MADTAPHDGSESFQKSKFAFLERVHRAPGLTATAKNAAFVIVNRIGPGQHAAWPSIETVAYDIGASYDTAKRAVRILREAGVLIVRQRRHEPTRSGSNVYAPNLSWQAEPVEDRGAAGGRTVGAQGKSAPTPQGKSAPTPQGKSAPTPQGKSAPTPQGKSAPQNPKGRKPTIRNPSSSKPSTRARAREAADADADARHDSESRSTSPTSVPAEAPKTAWQGQRRETSASANPYEKEDRVDEVLSQASRTACQLIGDSAFDEIARTGLSAVIEDARYLEWDKEGAGQNYLIDEVVHMAAALERGAAE